MRSLDVLHSCLVLCITLTATGIMAAPPAFGPSGWSGGEPDAAVRKVWPQSICWRHGKSNSLGLPFAKPQDWSQYGTLALWLHSEKATGSHFVMILPSENPKTEGSDYYSHEIVLDWTGWKRFVMPFAELSAAREPLGWPHISGIHFTASGYDNTPDPDAVVRLDGIELLPGVAGRQMTDAELIESLDLNPPPLAAVKRAVAAGDLTAAKAALAAHLRNRTMPRWQFDWRQPAFRDGKSKPNPGKLVAAEKILKHQFDYTKGPGRNGTLDFGAKIDWTANPTEGEARTHLWNESINRHFHFRTLADAYWQSGDERFAREIAQEILDWTASNPPLMLSSGNSPANGCEAWQTLTTGIRLADTWPTALYRCLGSPAFNDEVIWTIFKSVCTQARHLVRWPSSGNWLTAESNGLFTAGVLFPEFREAAQWRRIALERLYKQLDEDVYPDGMQFELAAGYNNWVVSEFAGILELADLNDRRPEVPADYLAKMEKMFNYLLYASMPNGQIPGLNDSGNSDVRKLLETGYQLFPKREAFRFVASGGQKGRVPAETSHAFPYAGHYVMRSGWNPEATYLLFDGGPYGKGHQHEDKLHFVLWSHGRQLVLDPGNFSYDRSRWRRYVLSTAGHNTVLVDGRGQHRAGKKETHVWPKPWNTPLPSGNDTRWLSTPDYDVAIGVYADGYGPKSDVTHRRRVLLLKSANVILISDTLTPRDGAEHQYDALFHLDTAKAVADDNAQTVRTDNAGEANLWLVPLQGDGISLTIVQGKEDEPVQGWASGPWRAVPTAIYHKAAAGTVDFHFALEPLAKNASPTIRGLEKTGAGLRILFADGHTLDVARTDEGDEVTLTDSGKP
jgi:hypothetical protein